MSRKADIVIVNWNSGHLLGDCIESLERYSGGIGTVIIVDNGSEDSSECVTSKTLKLIIRRLGENLGFARACNIGAAISSTAYLLFLNPDTLFLNDSALPNLLKYLDSPHAQDIGIAGIRLINENGETQQSCANFINVRTFLGQPFYLDKLFPTIFTPLFASFDYNQSRDVDQAIGAYFVVRSATFSELRGFDERFFVYWEEVDFCFRAHCAGWRTFYFAEAVAFHKGNGSSDRVKAKRLFYEHRSRVQYAMKHFSLPSASAVLFFAAFVEPLSRLLRALLRGSQGAVSDTFSGYKLFWRSIPDIIKEAMKEKGMSGD